MVSRVLGLATVTAFLAVFSVAPAQAAAITIDMLRVGDAGNMANIVGRGAVAYDYQIGKYDITNIQYCTFLNTVASSGDPYALWNSNMQMGWIGGINRAGTGPYTYTVKPGQGNQPVNDISWFDALRFVNWLDNGQGTMASTETGTYTLLGGTADAV
jgi:hypothetical protein